jgi:hypothetical protein
MRRLALAGWLAFAGFSAFSLAFPLPISAEISITSVGSAGSLPAGENAASAEIVKKALARLADDPRLAGHPVRRYLYNTSAPLKIVFYSPAAGEEAKVVNHNEIHIRAGRDLPYYLRILTHELIHIGMMEKYGDTCNYSFLPPEDYAFLNLMEEAFANAAELWVYLSFPEFSRDYKIRNSQFQNGDTKIADAMRNDFREFFPGMDEETARNRVAGEMFNLFMTSKGAYTLEEIPRNMIIAYGRRNTMLIPEYAAYGVQGGALLRHVWNYLASVMPFGLPARMTYDYYRSMFMSWLTLWNAYAGKREESIYYWVKHDAAGAARARLEAQAENERAYDFIPAEDEKRLNRVMAEIRPGFVPVKTERAPRPGPRP